MLIVCFFVILVLCWIVLIQGGTIQEQRNQIYKLKRQLGVHDA